MYSGNDTLAGGLPHSDICGSKPARGSPQLFAACYVLRRLLVPRHPPNALIALTLTMHRNHLYNLSHIRLFPHASCKYVTYIFKTHLNASCLRCLTHHSAKAERCGSDQPATKRHAQIRTNRFTLTKISHQTHTTYAPQRGSIYGNVQSLTLPYDRLLDNHLVKMVETDGFEPTTPCLQSRCSPS